MKVCLINNLYGSLAVGGTEKFVEKMAGKLVSSGQEVFIITTRPWFWRQKQAGKKEESAERIYYLRSLYANLNAIPLAVRFFWHIADMFDLPAALKIGKILKKEKPDIVYTHNLKGMSFLAPRVISGLGLKHIHFLHDIQLFYPSGLITLGQEKKLNDLLAGLYSFFCRFLFSRANEAVSPSRWLMAEHLRRGFFAKAKKSIRRPSLDLNSALKKLSQRKQAFVENRKKEFVFLYAGQIEAHKGVFFLLDSFKRFNRDAPDRDVKLIFAGAGRGSKKIRQWCGENIIFAGKLKSSRLRRLMENCDCLVMPSLCWENAPMVLLEAVEAGLPVLAADIGGIPEIVKLYGGRLFKAGSMAGLSSEMKNIVSNYGIFLDSIYFKIQKKADKSAL